ncbi:MAG: ATP-dependent DNA helicase RecQ [Sphaerospermopsis sp. SIO1G1]|nr:ATP-dependent DNA helicase RecQ [Sphaerospermopsis sp. SIO1G1]
MNLPKNTEIDEICTALKVIWGYSNFRPPQREIVNSILSAKDALIIMPTGAGKSICFQLPALIKTGLTLVVSPLVALMENQVEELRQKRQKAALLHSTISASQKRITLQSIEKQQLRLLYLSPETLLSSPVWERLSHPELKINGIILDEAHCLVQWGDTFRPAYRRLGAVRPALLQTKPPGTKISLAAFTATADPIAKKIISEVLKLQQPASFKLNPYRANLSLEVRITWTPRGRKKQLLKFIQKHENQTGLIYVRNRKDSDELVLWLTEIGYNTVSYHAGLGATIRREIEESWFSGKVPFVVCTSAFGMGINKPDVRWVTHFHAPHLLSEYLQEIGRAGRDGKPAAALTLISEPTGFLDNQDQQRQQFFEQQIFKQQQKAQMLVKKLPERGELTSIIQQFPDVAMALSLLHSSGKLQWLDPFNYQILNKPRNLLNQQSQGVKQMRKYLYSKKCRWWFLLDAFGFGKEAENWRCGHCDNCQN